MPRVRKSNRVTIQARPKGKPYLHQGLLAFAKQSEWKFRILERFQQNTIHFNGMIEKPNSVLIELGSHKHSPGGLMVDPVNLIRLAHVFNVSPKLYVESRGRGNNFFFIQGDDRLTRSIGDSFAQEAYRDMRSYLNATSNEIKKRIGKAFSLEFVDQKGKPVMVYRHYYRRASPPNQYKIHRWFVEFFPHESSLKIAEAITERNAREAGPRYIAWAQKKAKELK